MILPPFKHVRCLEVAVGRDIKLPKIEKRGLRPSHRRARSPPAQDQDPKVQRSVTQFIPRTAVLAYLLI